MTAEHWSGLPRVGEPTAAGLAAWLDELEVSREAVRALDLARGWPTWTTRDAAPWATWQRATWTEGGCRAVLPTFGPFGEQAGIRAVLAGGEPGPRGSSSAGTVYADPVARWLLAAGREAKAGALVDGSRWRWSGRVAVCTGAATWIQAVTAPRRPDRESTAAVFGVWPGGWSPSIGARIPPGAELVLVGLGAELEAVIRGSVDPGVGVKRARSEPVEPEAVEHADGRPLAAVMADAWAILEARARGECGRRRRWRRT